MSSTHINRWLHVARDPSPHWRDLGLSVGMTAALFAAALAAMTSLRPLALTQDTAPVEHVAWIPIPVPAPVVKPPPAAVPSQTAPRQSPATPAIAPREIPNGVAPAIPAIQAVPQSPVLSAPPAVDSSPKAATKPAPSSRDIPMSMLPPKTLPYKPRPDGVGAAPLTPSGVTAPRAPMTAATRDSLAAAASRAWALALKAPFTAEERKKVAAQMQPVPTLPVAGVASTVSTGPGGMSVVTTGGELAGRTQTDVHIGVSLPFPVLEPGPSPAKRKRDAIVAAENQARLYRLQDRVYQKRDSMRLDSLRRDSLAMKKKPAQPPTPFGS